MSTIDRVSRMGGAWRGALTTFKYVAAAALAVASIGCGGTSTSPASSQKVTASEGATLTAGAATLTIPPGALTHDTTVTVHRGEPQHAGRVARVDIEPHDALAPGHEALLSFRVDDANAMVKMHHGADDALQDVEVDDRNQHAFKTHMGRLDDVEVELEHGTASADACDGGQGCDAGLSQDHDHAGSACGDVCPVGQECDGGVCKTHDACATDHHGTPGECSPGCASGLTCHDGICSAHE